MPKKKTAAPKQKKLPRIKPINNFALLMVLSVFQLLSGTAVAPAPLKSRCCCARWH